MLDGYHRIFNGHALKEVARPADIPQPSLGIGWAERLTNTPLIIRYEPVVQPAVVPRVMSVQDMAPKLAGQQVPISAFPSTGWMGDMLGGGY